MREYNKLVRDKIPEIISNNGENPKIRILDNIEYKKELDRKLLEEVNEYLKDDNVEELADVEEVLLTILDYKDISREEFEKIRKEKESKRGAFKEKIYLEKVEEF